ncbi:MAG: hypothetical protein Q9218_000724 [Villophora microphyllina]
MHPGAQERYAAQLDLIAQVSAFQEEQNPYRWVRDLRFVDAHPRKNRARALDPPIRRSYRSNANRPKSFWHELESLKQPRRHFDLDTNYPREWDLAIRPIIARLYKESIIGNAYMEWAPGQAFAYREPGRDLDLYFDIRIVQSDISIPGYMEDPPSISALLCAAREFATEHPTARFALLRL